MANILIIDAFGSSRLCRQASTRFLNQLLGGLIHTNNGKVLAIGSFVNIKYAFHMGNKFTALFGRNDPPFYLPRLKFVFLKPFGPLRGKYFPHSRAGPFYRPKAAKT